MRGTKGTISPRVQALDEAEQPATNFLEVTIGEGDDGFRFRVLGERCPEATDDWYRAQLNAELYIAAGRFRGFRSMVMFTDDWHMFEHHLQLATDGKRPVLGTGGWLSLQTGDWLSLDISQVESGDQWLQAWLQVDALQDPVSGGWLERDEDWEWRIPLRRETVPRVLTEVRTITSRYPVWSVARPTWSVPRG